MIRAFLVCFTLLFGFLNQSAFASSKLYSNLIMARFSRGNYSDVQYYLGHIVDENPCDSSQKPGAGAVWVKTLHFDGPVLKPKLISTPNHKQLTVWHPSPAVHCSDYSIVDLNEIFRPRQSAHAYNKRMYTVGESVRYSIWGEGLSLKQCEIIGIFSIKEETQAEIDNKTSHNNIYFLMCDTEHKGRVEIFPTYGYLLHSQ